MKTTQSLSCLKLKTEIMEHRFVLHKDFLRLHQILYEDRAHFVYPMCEFIMIYTDFKVVVMV
jgi:hypothetical protein